MIVLALGCLSRAIIPLGPTYRPQYADLYPRFLVPHTLHLKLWNKKRKKRTFIHTTSLNNFIISYIYWRWFSLRFLLLNFCFHSDFLNKITAVSVVADKSLDRHISSLKRQVDINLNPMTYYPTTACCIVVVWWEVYALYQILHRTEKVLRLCEEKLPRSCHVQSIRHCEYIFPSESFITLLSTWTGWGFTDDWLSH